MTTETATPIAFTHTGSLRNIIGLAAKNAILGIVTLTLYRFWARTSVRRRVWSRAWVMGDPFEYTGAGWELFRGFLISLPTFFLPAIFVFYIAPFALEPVYAVWLTLGFYVLVVPLIAAARYWMRRYQLSRTRWRGIQLGLAGSAWGFAFASWGWSVLQLLTLGWYTPVARMNRARMLWENARFGDQPFEFARDPEGDARGLWWPFALGWFGFPIAMVAGWIAAVATIVPFAAAMAGTTSTANPAAMGAIGIVVVALWLIFTLAAWLFTWMPYRAAAMNRIASMISIDGARFKLRANTWSLFGISLLGWLITIFSLTLLAPLAGLLQVRYIVNRLEITHPPRFAEIGQAIAQGPRSGESFADAFDLDLGVGMI
ncbi:MAG: DUF898 family protein [Hyphomonadaceae bacterium]